MLKLRAQYRCLALLKDMRHHVEMLRGDTRWLLRALDFSGVREFLGHPDTRKLAELRNYMDQWEESMNTWITQLEGEEDAPEDLDEIL